MMLLGSHFNRRAFPGTVPQPVHGSPVRVYSTPHEKPAAPTSLSLNTLPTWVTQALCDLTQGEQELHRLQERQTAEVDEVNEGLDSAILGAQREERRQLERVERDHREAQQKLEQLKRENAAAARVGQSLLDQQLRKVGQMKEQIQRWGSCANGPNKSQLLRGVRELTQPWEISLSLKRVSFQPSAQPKAISFGEIDVQEHSLSFPVGVCGPQGQKCAIHTGELPCSNHVAVTEQLAAPCNGEGADNRESSKTNSGSTRIVRKIRLSSTDEDVLGEEVKLPTAKPRLWPRKRDTSESSQDEDLESLGSDTRGDYLFLAIPPISSQGESEGEGPGTGHIGDRRRSASRGHRKQRTLVLVSSREPSCPPEGSGPDHGNQCQRSEDYGRDREGLRQGSQRGMSRYGYKTVTSPKTSYSGAQSSHSCLDLTSKDHPRLRQSRSLDKHPLEMLSEARRPPSPADSMDSSNTFTISSSSNRSGSLKREYQHSISTADLSPRSRPLINGGKGEYQGAKRVNRARMSSVPSNLGPSPMESKNGGSPSSQENRESSAQRPLKGICKGSSQVCRSLSMSAIEGQALHPARVEQHVDRGRRERRTDLSMVKVEEERRTFKVGHLIRKFGKQGSGRTDFTLPSGVHTTPQGQLFVVDCGNVRVQVTDLQRNVVQQVTPPTAEGSARHCRNFFDVAANAKGLIALTCAAERALLVFSRHGRLLQTFGGGGSGAVQQELEAPRGVTVTRLDEFLVADIRRGTLTALKLDPKTGARTERTVVTGFHRPYLVAACATSGLMVVSERGNETGRAPCIRVLEPGWNTIRILGVCSGMGPVLACPWGICIDRDGDVLVADWGKQHRVVLYPAAGVGRPIITQGLSSPRGLALLPEGHLVVSDSMNHCIKIYRYK